MKTTGIFRLYEPVEENLKNDAKTIKENTGMDIVFLRTEEGELWHEAQYQFMPGTLKICFNAERVITMYSNDATLLNPINCAVAEVDSSDVPVGLDESHEWAYIDGEVKPRIYTAEEYRQKAKLVRNELISTALADISVIQLKLQTGRKLSADETVRLNATLDYIDKVESTDLSDAPVVNWPKKNSVS
ncbi:tail fiber assembly protein [Enterobacter hormaechei subsp. steigerwaltii]|uniref:tail fiber assembly protein n=1 Tax=Enterobacter hormaechei TaxID=158836 RepID=UPI000758052A|nr:tail fiber assembly protein [Enterobacter hormaechei]KVI90661.1 hypothetical protein AWS43_21695 [Enterobacter hormaechei subsp. steigerwaltii]OYE44414.1 tail fiber assembly protein [Enterobacter hormaechei subsp. steigerwaltii]